MPRLAHSTSIVALVLLTLDPICPANLQAQRDANVGPWFSVALGAGQQSRTCASCASSQHQFSPSTSYGGITGQLGAGLTLTRAWAAGITLAAWNAGHFDVESDGPESNRNAVYYLATVRYKVFRDSRLMIRGNIGRSDQSDAIDGGEASAPVLGLGITLRGPVESALGLAVNVDWLETLSGRFRYLNEPTFPYRSRMIAATVSLDFAWFP